MARATICSLTRLRQLLCQAANVPVARDHRLNLFHTSLTNNSSTGLSSAGVDPNTTVCVPSNLTDHELNVGRILTVAGAVALAGTAAAQLTAAAYTSNPEDLTAKPWQSFHGTPLNSFILQNQQPDISSNIALRRAALSPPQLTEGTAYQVYRKTGEPQLLSELLARLHEYDVVLLGEHHDDPVAHHVELGVYQAALQRAGLIVPKPQSSQGAPGSNQGNFKSSDSTTRGLHNSHGSTGDSTGPNQALKREVILSLEMFERDVQGIMDEYLAGLIQERDLLNDGRAWDNYLDYRPLVLLAKQAGQRVICANAPRRYVSLVGKKGAQALQKLPAHSCNHLPPLPYPAASDRYMDKIAWSMEMMRGGPDMDTEDNKAGATSAQDTQHQSSSGNVKSSQSSAQTGVMSQQPTRNADAESVSAQSASAQQSAQPADATPGGSGECPYIGLGLDANFFDAQNLWDACMAHAIADALGSRPNAISSRTDIDQQGSTINSPTSASIADAPAPGALTSTQANAESMAPRSPLVVHVCGKMHCEHHLGIVEHLKHYAPQAKVLVVTFVPCGSSLQWSKEQFNRMLLQHMADYVVLTDAKLPRSFDVQHPV